MAFLENANQQKRMNKVRAHGGVEGRGKGVMGREEDTHWDEHRVLFVRQFDNTLKT